MMTAAPGGTRYVPVPVVVQRSSSATMSRPSTTTRSTYRYQPVPPEDHYEREAGRRYRRIIAARIARAAGWTERPLAQVSRQGIAQDYFLAQRQLIEARARDVARQIGLTDGRIQRANHVFGSR
jgi:hypothetical protein